MQLLKSVHVAPSNSRKWQAVPKKPSYVRHPFAHASTDAAAFEYMESSAQPGSLEVSAISKKDSDAGGGVGGWAGGDAGLGASA